MSDLFAKGNSIGGSGAGGAGSYGSGAGGAGEFGKGAGGVGEYGSGAGGSGVFGSGAGGAGVGVNFNSSNNGDNHINSERFFATPDTLNDPVNSDSLDNRKTINNSKFSDSQRTFKREKLSYSISSPITYFLLNLIYPTIYIPLVLAFISVGINLISWLIVTTLGTNNSLGMSLLFSFIWLTGLIIISIYHRIWINRLKQSTPK